MGAESTVDTVPGSFAAFHAVASEPGIVYLPSAAEPAATALLQPVTAEGEQSPLGPARHLAERSERNISSIIHNRYFD